MDLKEFEETLAELESRLDRLRALYENWYRGYEKTEPRVARRDVERRVYGLRKELPRNTALRFRYHQLYQRYTTLSTYWQRTTRQIEEGTHRLQVQRFRRKKELQEELPRVEQAHAEDAESDVREREERARPLSYELSLDDESLSIDDLLNDTELDAVARAVDRPGPHTEPPLGAKASRGTFAKPKRLSSRPPSRGVVPMHRETRSSAPPPAQQPAARRSAAGGFDDERDPPTGLHVTLEEQPSGAASLPRGSGAQRAAVSALQAALPPRHPGAASLGQKPLVGSLPTGGPHAAAPGAPAPMRAGPPAPPSMRGSLPGAPGTPSGASPVGSMGPRSPLSTGSAPGQRQPPLSAPGVGLPRPSLPGAVPPPRPGAVALPPAASAPLAGPPSAAGRPSGELSPGRAVLPGASGSTPARPGASAPSGQRPAASAPGVPPARPAMPQPPRPSGAQSGSTIVGRPPTASPLAGAPRPEAQLEDQKLRRLYQQYADARRKNNEGEVRYEALVGSIQRMLPDLQKKHAGKQIDFEVVVKDGRVGLKPKPT